MHSGMRYRHGNAAIAIRADLNGTETSINSTIEELKRRHRGEATDKAEIAPKYNDGTPTFHQFHAIAHPLGTVSRVLLQLFA
ncbi:hypothetical protein K0M31_007442 [Melipona bicolor]|uniref:Uncharacterized protein n=1 Tax=Melipona bicolor TaxID=60889 RepID=A0AA40GBE6_9HYME|nr:hypothetical protein K0M31_007442 [Melipona bicolor]